MNPHLFALLRDGVVAASQHPRLARALNSCAGRGETVRLLPGVHALPDQDSLDVRLQAVRAYGAGDLVVIRRSAAALTWWPELGHPDLLQVAGRHSIDASRGYAFEQRFVRPELTIRRFGVLVANAELVVLDLIDDLGAVAIDEALRRRAITIPRLQRALRLTPNRRGNRHRRELIEDSRDEPWSPLEREAHALLRGAGLTNWKANWRVEFEGNAFYLDVAFREAKLALEFDGAEHHATAGAFQEDRRRDRILARAGWRVVRFTAQSLGELVDTTRSLLADRRPTRPVEWWA